jgi:hypothetical protein
VPSPKKKKEWNVFWKLYKAEKGKFDQWINDGSVDSVHLDILNMQLTGRNSSSNKRGLTSH